MSAALPSRARSTRTAAAAHLANTARTLQPPAPSSSSSTATTNLSSPSPVSIFLRNVRLLDLDTLPDWPGLSAATFAAGSGNGAQGQKKRVQCVEWILFQLFTIWDIQLARDKLKPFFPPLDQVQSTNLRAALLRALEQIKKNGVLGRDAIIRKTMLDECKGERLEEVLASFSSAVLKKVILDETAEHGDYPTPVLEVATEDRGYKGETTDLQALILMHKVSLQGALARREAAQRTYKDFANLLEVKERKLDRRKEEMRAKEGDDPSSIRGMDAGERERERLRRTIVNNWTGDERWMEALLYGDAGSTTKDGFTDMALDRVWRRMEQGRLSELEAAGTGLLEQLDTRVRVQRERMQKWDAFRRRMFSHQSNLSPSKQKMTELSRKKKEKTKGVDLGFTAHESLQPGSTQQRVAVVKSLPLNAEYAEMIQNMKAELEQGNHKAAESLGFLRHYRPHGSQDASPASTGEEVISELSEFTEEDEDAEDDMYPSESEPPPIKSFQTRLEGLKRLPVRPKVSYVGYDNDDAGTPTKSSGRLLRQLILDEDEDEDQDGEGEGEDETIRFETAPPSDSASQRTATKSRSISPLKPPSPLEPPSPTQEMADQILDAMDSYSPSPVKRTKKRPTLSLADRARLSMARSSSAFLQPEEEDEEDEEQGFREEESLLLPPPTLLPSALKHTFVSEPLAEEEEEEPEPDNLLSRTRKSMAGFEKAVQKAHLERRRSQRRSRLPPPRRETNNFPATVDEEEQQAREEKAAALLAEELMAEEDMEAVFRSRPKIAASPLLSPTREW